MIDAQDLETLPPVLLNLAVVLSLPQPNPIDSTLDPSVFLTFITPTFYKGANC